MNKAIGKLFLIPNTIGDVSPEDVMSHFIRDAINTTQFLGFENREKTKKNEKNILCFKIIKMQSTSGKEK